MCDAGEYEMERSRWITATNERIAALKDEGRTLELELSVLNSRRNALYDEQEKLVEVLRELGENDGSSQTRDHEKQRSILC